MQGQYVGSVKSWNTEKGWGHIECQQISEMYGKDCFLMRSGLVGLRDVSKGDVVTFNVTQAAKGPEAANVQLSHVLPTAGAQQFFQKPQQQPAMQNPYMNMQAQAYPPQQGGGLVGTVKSWNPVSGWGHIESAEITNLFGKDLFFMKSQVLGGDIVKGATVRCTAGQGSKGPEAQGIQVLQGPGMAHHQGAAGGAPVGGAGGQNATYFGTVKSFNDEKGWGHIDCQKTQAMYGKDMFFMRSCIADQGTVTQGETVQFNVRMGQKGPEAFNVRGMPLNMGQPYVGSIKQFNPESGFGFIACDETRAVLQRDIFLHKKELHGQEVNVGDPVQFVLNLAADGRPEATNVTFPQNGYGYGAPPVQMGKGQRASPY